MSFYTAIDRVKASETPLKLYPYVECLTEPLKGIYVGISSYVEKYFRQCRKGLTILLSEPKICVLKIFNFYGKGNYMKIYLVMYRNWDYDLSDQEDSIWESLELAEKRVEAKMLECYEYQRSNYPRYSKMNFDEWKNASRTWAYEIVETELNSVI